MKWLWNIISKSTKLVLGDGDYLVFQFSEDINITEVEQLTKEFRENLPELSDKILFFYGNMKIYVVHEENK